MLPNFKNLFFVAGIWRGFRPYQRLVTRTDYLPAGRTLAAQTL